MGAGAVADACNKAKEGGCKSVLTTKESTESTGQTL